ncbi:MAG: hypothetical protein KBA72_11705 [Thermoanaerobaculia bacterium]|nr:hypothetical protein [Thermoanaerobaculia bacterium]
MAASCRFSPGSRLIEIPASGSLPRLGIAPAGAMVYVVAVGGAVLLVLLLKVLGIFK